MLVIILAISVVLLTSFVMFLWNKHFGSQPFIKVAIGAIALGFGITGFDELDRGGHQTLRRILRNCAISWLAAALVLLSVARLRGIATLDLAIDWSMYLFWLLFASSFPVAFYMSRKKPKTDFRPTPHNAS